jgi:putative ABC transport system permease protein
MKEVIKTITRNFIHRPVINIINLLGLSVSLTLVIVLSVYSYSELTTDKFHKHGGDIFLLEKNKNDRSIYTPGVLAETINGKIPGVISVVRLTCAWNTVVFQANGRDPLVADLVFSDEDFFKLFSYKSLEGDLGTALNDPFSLVISESLSAKLFGKESAIGRTVKYDNDRIFTITAVFKEPDSHTCFHFNALTSIDTKKILEPDPGQFTQWGWNSFQTFLFLEKNFDKNDIMTSLVQFVPQERDQRAQYSNADLIAFRDIYFSNFWVFNDYMVFGNLKKTLTLLMVALLVLLIALVNFVNISASQWRERIRQFGIMKVLGADRLLVAREIMTESLVFFLTALILATQLSSAVSPLIHEFTGIIYNDRIIGNPGFLGISILCVFFLSIIISLIPAVSLSSSKALDNLKKSILSEKRKYSANGTLVTIQFIVAIALIAFTILVQKQVSYGSSSLGMNQENIVGIKLTPQLSSAREVLKTALGKDPVIDRISFSEYYPGKQISNWGVEMNLKSEKKMVFFDTFCADEKFFSLMGLQLIFGRFYSDSLSTDQNKVIVNESFLKKNNISDPIGMTFYTFTGTPTEIIGVIRDFHHRSMSSEIAPLIIRNEKDYSYCTVHVTTNDFNALKRTLNGIRKTAADLSPSFPVEVSFMDNAIQGMYNSELMFSRAFMLLAVCALLISCLGILAMSVSASQKRVKEIGIRRVNGATVYEVILMLNGDLVKWVVMAFIVSSFISGYFMNLWLQNYVYKTQVSWWIFAVSGLTALLIALITVSRQTWKAATRNPVEALRYE